MMNDINLSKKLFDDYKYSGIAREGLSVEVLTHGHWTDLKPFKCNLPPELTFFTDSFQYFYNKKYEKRVLTWLPQHGTVEVKPLL